MEDLINAFAAGWLKFISILVILVVLVSIICLAFGLFSIAKLAIIAHPVCGGIGGIILLVVGITVWAERRVC